VFARYTMLAGLEDALRVRVACSVQRVKLLVQLLGVGKRGLGSPFVGLCDQSWSVIKGGSR